MKLSALLIMLLLITSALSCSRQPELATSALATDFDGRWIGKWNWSASNETSLEISGDRVMVTSFPILHEPVIGDLIVVSTAGTATFENAYGSRGLPCILLSFPGPQEVMSVFIAQDKKRLIYNVSVNRDWQIAFIRDN